MKIRILAFALAIATFIPSVASAAYIDPGTGSMILQAAVAGIAGAVLVLRTYWHRLRSIFSRGGDQEQK